MNNQKILFGQDLNELKNALLQNNICTFELPLDGIVQRISTHNNQPKTGYCTISNDKKGSYAVFGDRFKGTQFRWMLSCPKKLNDYDRKIFDLLSRKVDLEFQKDLARTANKVKKFWERAKPATNLDFHPYLQQKNYPLESMRKIKTAALIPIYDDKNLLQSLQIIGPQGRTRYFASSQISGYFFPFQKNNQTDTLIILCDDFASSAIIHQTTGYSTLCTFEAWNLLAVAKLCARKDSARQIIIAGSHHQPNTNDENWHRAQEAAIAVHGQAIFPIAQNKNSRVTKFIDLFLAEGKDAISKQINDCINLSQSEPYPFLRKKDGVYFVEEEEGTFNHTKICSPLKVRGLSHNPNNEEWGRYLRVTDVKGTGHDWAMPMRMTVSGSRWLEELLNLGLTLPNQNPNETHRIKQYITNSPEKNIFLCLEKIGWHKNIFVLPNQCFPSQERNYIFQGVKSSPFSEHGNFEQWQENVAKYAQGNSRLILALCTGFAAPLIYLSGSESFGIHFFGDSSTGKTTTLHIASSLFGCGTTGYAMQWRTTDNALESIASLFCDCLLCLDEIGQCSSKVVSEMSYMLANGKGKSRMNKDAQLKDSYKWRILFLSNGELSAAEKISETGIAPKPGQIVRMIDIPAAPRDRDGIFECYHEFTSGADLSDHLRNTSTAYYGTAFPKYMELIVSDLENIKNSSREQIKSFQNQHSPQGATKTTHRVAARFGLLAFAGELAIKIGVLPLEKGEASQAAKTCFEDWMISQGGGDVDRDLAQALSRLKSIIQVYGSSRFGVIPICNMQKPIENLMGYKKVTSENDAPIYHIFPSIFRKEICKGVNYRKIANLLKDRGILIARNGRLTNAIWKDNCAQGMYAIDAAKLFNSAKVDKSAKIPEI